MKKQQLNHILSIFQKFWLPLVFVAIYLLAVSIPYMCDPPTEKTIFEDHISDCERLTSPFIDIEFFLGFFGIFIPVLMWRYFHISFYYLPLEVILNCLIIFMIVLSMQKFYRRFKNE